MKRLLYLFLLVLVIAGLYGVYLFNKKPADTRKMTADFEISSTDLVNAFTTDEEVATKRYVDKTLIVSGTVNDVDTTSSTVFLSASDPLTSVTCNFYSDESIHLTGVRKGDRVSIKGKCTGKLMDVVLNNCSLIEK